MSRPVDVRAVIAAVIEDLRADGNTGHVQNLLDADAAVAELIGAVERAMGASRCSPIHRAAMRAALANVGGAA